MTYQSYKMDLMIQVSPLAARMISQLRDRGDEIYIDSHPGHDNVHINVIPAKRVLGRLLKQRARERALEMVDFIDQTWEESIMDSAHRLTQGDAASLLDHSIAIPEAIKAISLKLIEYNQQHSR